MYYEDVFKALYEHRVRYLVVGAVAMNLHGAPRMTSDLDLMLDLTRPNIARFIEAVSVLGYKPKAHIEVKELLDPANRRLWAREKNMVVLSLHNSKQPYRELDVFIENPIDFKSAYKNRSRCKAGGLVIEVTSVDDLISLKEKAGRKQDKSDITVLNKLKKTGGA